MRKEWYAIYTSPRCEKRVYAELLKRGFDCYLPLQTRVSQWSDRKKTLEYPIIESYVFVKTFSTDLLNILSIHGVAMFISDRRKNPLALSENFIEKLRVLAKSGVSSLNFSLPFVDNH